MKLAARLLSILFIFVLLLFTTKQTFAQTYTTQSSGTNFSSPNLQTQNIVINTLSAIACQLTGINPSNPNQACLQANQKTGQTGFINNNGGVVGTLTSMIKNTFNVPVHFGEYVAYTKDNFGLAKKTYAQGIGFIGLQPILPLFTIFRNVSYVLIIFIFVIVGIGIMLRLKIDPRTVMTVQNQIPKLIIGLVMITFSYAIAGFLIDLMWVSTYFVINTMVPAEKSVVITSGLTQGAPGFVSTVYSDRGGLAAIAADAAGTVGGLISGMLDSPRFPSPPSDGGSGCDPIDVFCNVGNFFEGTIQSLMSNIFATLLGIAGAVVAFLIFAVAIIVQLFKLWFALLKAFISVLLDVILAPIWILAGLIPGAGANLGFGAWFRDLIANLAVFPAVVFLFVIARVIAEGFTDPNVTAGPNLAFNPPLIGNASGDSNALGALIGLGFILSAPHIVETIKKALKAGGPGVGLGGVNTGSAVMGAVGGGVWGRMYRRDSRTGELRGLIGARVQRRSLGGINEDTGKFNPGKLRKTIAFVTKAPSANDLEGTSHVQREEEAWKARQKAKNTSSGGSTPPPPPPPPSTGGPTPPTPPPSTGGPTSGKP